MKLVIFDLDGTLIDSAEDIARSVNEMLSERGRPSLPRERIRSYVGDGVRKLMERVLVDVPAAEIENAQERYLAIYRRRLLDTTRPYAGASAMLEELGRRGIALAVLTNKPLRETRMILDGLDLARHFRFVHGGDSFERRKPDPMGVRSLLDEVSAKPEEALLVGDTVVDLRTARNAGVISCLVTHGAPGLAEVSQWPPDHVIAHLGDLVGIL